MSTCPTDNPSPGSCSFDCAYQTGSYTGSGCCHKQSGICKSDICVQGYACEQDPNNPGSCLVKSCYTPPEGCNSDPYYSENCSTSCIPIEPEMNATSIAACCAGVPSMPSPAVGTCAAGYCPDGSQCIASMINLCSTPLADGTLNPLCYSYLSQTTPTSYGPSTVLAGMLKSGLAGGYNATNPFNAVALKYCSRFPGACDDALRGYCSLVDRTSLVTDDNLRNLCGCFLSVGGGSSSNPGVSSNYPFADQGVSVVCDPVCSAASIQQGTFTNNGWQANRCTEPICIIDDVTLDLAQSSGGNLNISQVCGGTCGSPNTSGAGCSSCYISGATIENVNSIIGNETLSQACGVCYGDDGSAISCSSGSTIDNGWFQTIRAWFISHHELGIAFAVLLAIIILTLMIVGAVMWWRRRNV